MAIYCLYASVINRSSGRSSVASAAYRAGEKLRNNNDGVTHDYSRKGGVVHNEILLPKNAPQEYADRSTLWNAVEKVESRKDAQTAREVLLALPVEFSRDENIAISKEYIGREFVSRGMIADFVLHDKQATEQ